MAGNCYFKIALYKLSAILRFANRYFDLITKPLYKSLKLNPQILCEILFCIPSLIWAYQTLRRLKNAIFRLDLSNTVFHKMGGLGSYRTPSENASPASEGRK